MDREPAQYGNIRGVGIALDNSKSLNARQQRAKDLRKAVKALGPVVESGTFVTLGSKFGISPSRVSVVHRETFQGCERKIIDQRNKPKEEAKPDIEPQFLDEQGKVFRDALSEQAIERLAWQSRRTMMLMQTGRFDLARKQLAECEKQLQHVESEQDLEETIIADLSHRSALRWGNTLEQIGVFTVKDFLERRKEEIIKLPNVGPGVYQTISDLIFKLMQRRGESSVVKS
jgi:hypothetical protein